MKPVPRIQLIQSWQTYSKGCFLWPHAMLRNWLIATGRAVMAAETPQEKPVVSHTKAKRKGT